MSTLAISKHGGLVKLATSTGENQYVANTEPRKFKYNVNGQRQTVALANFSADGINEVQGVVLTGFTTDGTNEVQTVELTGFATNGNNEVQSFYVVDGSEGEYYKLAFSGETTADIAFDADAATVKTELEALSNIGASDLTVTGAGSIGDPFLITFGGTLAKTNVDEITHVAGTTPGDLSVVIATVTAGVPNDAFKITYGGNESALITRGSNYTAAGIKAAIEAITDFDGTVTVTLVVDAGFTVTFGGDYAKTDVSALTITSGVGCSGVVTEATKGVAEDAFKISFGGNESALVSRSSNYTAAGIKAAIEAITDFAGTVTISAISDDGFTVTFGGAYAASNVGALSITNPVGCSGVVTATTTGVVADSFKVTYGGNESAIISHGINYTAAGIKAAIQAITGIPGSVTVSGAVDSGFVVTFSGVDDIIVTPLTITSGVSCTGTVTQVDTVDITIGTFNKTYPIAALTVNAVAITSVSVFDTNIAVVYP